MVTGRLIIKYYYFAILVEFSWVWKENFRDLKYPWTYNEILYSPGPFLSLCLTCLPFIFPNLFLVSLEARVPAVLNCVIILQYTQFSWGSKAKCRLHDWSGKEKSSNVQTPISPLKSFFSLSSWHYWQRFLSRK